MTSFALNHMTVARLSFRELLELAARAGLRGDRGAQRPAAAAVRRDGPGAAGDLVREPGPAPSGGGRGQALQRLVRRQGRRGAGADADRAGGGGRGGQPDPAQRQPGHGQRRASGRAARGAEGAEADAGGSRPDWAWSNPWASRSARCATSPKRSRRSRRSAAPAASSWCMTRSTTRWPMAARSFPSIPASSMSRALSTRTVSLSQMRDPHRVLVDRRRPAGQYRADRRAAGGGLCRARSALRPSRPRSMPCQTPKAQLARSFATHPRRAGRPRGLTQTRIGGLHRMGPLRL